VVKVWVFDFAQESRISKYGEVDSEVTDGGRKGDVAAWYGHETEGDILD
jgi:hypothetical protein